MDWMMFTYRKLRMPPVNQVILITVLAEFILSVAVALIAPIFALYMVDDLEAPVTAVGFAVAIYWLVKSIAQLPVARYLDKNHGEIDDFYSMLGGLLLVTIAFFLYYGASSVWHVYLLQMLLGIGNAFVVPPFFAIFSRHLDKDREAFEWALWSSFSIGIGTAAGGALSGILAATAGIRSIFIIGGIFNLIGLIILIFLKPYIKPRVPQDLPRYEKASIAGP